MGKSVDGLVIVEPSESDPVVINPLNGVEMEKLRIGPVTIDRCPKSGAIWLDKGELAALAALDAHDRGLIKRLDQPRPGVVKRSGRGPLKSPRSGLVMMVVNDPKQKHVEFEVDPESGGCFFDAGELADLTEYSFVERIRAVLR